MEKIKSAAKHLLHRITYIVQLGVGQRKKSLLLTNTEFAVKEGEF